MSEILDYLNSNFLSSEQLSGRTGVSVDGIGRWVGSSCLPAPSYRLDGDGSVHSFFGIEPGVSPGGYQRFYFNPSHVHKLQSLELSTLEPAQIAKSLKRSFAQEYVATLVEHEMVRFGMNFYFDDAGEAGPVLDELLESEWGYYLDGTYGLCTRNADVKEIAIKEAMIKKIDFITVDRTKEDLTDHQREHLKNSVSKLDRVSSQFSPHEFLRSSRFKYIDQVRDKYQLHEAY
jgi:hypothetical protein